MPRRRYNSPSDLWDTRGIMEGAISRVIIVGGGSAGWLSAAVIAAEHRIDPQGPLPFELVLIESPDVPTIGVGEGTWPSMRSTLQRIGLSENDFLRECDASFKQGTWFRNWRSGDGDTYSHPFTVPTDFANTNLAAAWLALPDAPPFADAVTPQTALFADRLAPKQITTPEYAFVVNYGYHLDAGKFAALLRRHCTEKLGVTHVEANVSSINAAANGDIRSVTTDRCGEIAGDLFIDCTGTRALLLGEHYEVPFVPQQACLFNDTALAAQVPYADDDRGIRSCTHSTAQTSGWIWDIGLPTRRGIGHVYSSAHISDDEAEAQLLAYIRATAGDERAAGIEPRKIRFESGHRQTFWHRNCVAIGMSSGFIEPLEASALVMIEMAAAMIADQLPPTRDVMDLVARRYNRKFDRHWTQIIEFLKLHYVLSAREDSPYWRDNKSKATIPETLREQLAIWKHRPPWHQDAGAVDDLFPTASYQYILYGMGFTTAPRHTASHRQDKGRASELFRDNAARAAQLQQAMPTNRDLLDKVREYGFQKL